MEQFNIRKIIDYYQLDKEAVAKVLFPKGKHPFESMRRVLNGVSALDTNQVEALAEYIGVHVSDLYSAAEGWKGITEEGYLTFVKGPYKVRLGYKGILINIYKKGELIYSQVNCYAKMTVPEFINYINNLIEQYERD